MEKKGTVKFEFKAWGNINIYFQVYDCFLYNFILKLTFGDCKRNFRWSSLFLVACSFHEGDLCLIRVRIL